MLLSCFVISRALKASPSGVDAGSPETSRFRAPHEGMSQDWRHKPFNPGLFHQTVADICVGDGAVVLSVACAPSNTCQVKAFWAVITHISLKLAGR